MRNPFLGAVAAALVLCYLGVRGFHATALVAGVLIALLSLLALLRTWQRPSTETLFIVLLVVAPISGAAWSIASTPVQWALAYIGLGCAELAVGARRRDRGALYGGAVAMGIAALVLREWFDVPLEWKLIGAGVILFALSAAISRRLRGRQSGFVMTAVRDPREGATVILSSVFAPQGQAGPESHSGGGGDFGGAGSSATF